MHPLIATITLLLPIATAQVQVDARFYHDSDCKAFATGCANLPENTCCTVSDGGTVFSNSGSFYNTAAQLGVDINGNMYTLQEGVVNDCGIPACGDMGDGVCCDADRTLTGAAYTFLLDEGKMNKKKTPVAAPPRAVAADSYMWIDEDRAYYISKSNDTKMAAIHAMRKLRDYENLASFFKTHAEVVRE